MDDKELKEVFEKQLKDISPDNKLYFLVQETEDIYCVNEYDCWKERVYEDGVLNVEKTIEKIIPIIRELYPNKDIRY